MPINTDTTTPNPTPASSTALVPHDAASEPEYRAAADRVAPELAAMPDSDVDTVNLDIPVAVTSILGSWKPLLEYLPLMEAIPNVDVPRILKLRDYALALYYWQSSAMYASTTSPELPGMVEKAIAIRERTLNDLTALAGHGVIDASLLANFGGTTAYRKVGQDLAGLANLVHDRWDAIRGKSLLTLEAIDEAGRLGQAIMQSVGDRDRSPAASQAFASQQRSKAFTLFIRSYDEARRAMIFLRWHEGDVDTVFPSLYGGRRPRSRANEESKSTEVPAATTAPNATGTSGAAAPAARSSMLGEATVATSPSEGPFLRG